MLKLLLATTCPMALVYRSLSLAIIQYSVRVCMIFRAASSASGHSFYYLKGAAAMLELALIQYTMQKVIAKVTSLYPVIVYILCV